MIEKKEIIFWHPYSLLTFTRLRHIMWVAYNLHYFERYVWPPEPRGNYYSEEWVRDEIIKSKGSWQIVPHEGGNYIELQGKAPIKTEANFTRPAIVLAELNKRLKTARELGGVLIDEIQYGRQELWLCEDDKLQFVLPSREAFNVLCYIKGVKAKRMSYANWKRQCELRLNGKSNKLYG